MDKEKGGKCIPSGKNNVLESIVEVGEFNLGKLSVSAFGCMSHVRGLNMLRLRRLVWNK